MDPTLQDRVAGRVLTVAACVLSLSLSGGLCAGEAGNAAPHLLPPDVAQSAGLLVTGPNCSTGPCAVARVPVPGPFGEAGVPTRSRRTWPTRSNSTSDGWTFGDELTVRASAPGPTSDLTYALVDSQDDAQDAPTAVVIVEAAVRETRDLFVDKLGLLAPTRTEVVLTGATGSGSESYLAPSSSSSPHAVIFLDPDPQGGISELRGTAIRLYARAALRASGFAGSPNWAESIARWAQLSLDGQPDPASAALLGRRVARLDSGLFNAEPDLTAGNAIWLAYLHEAHGIHAVRLTIEELARGLAPHEALDRAVRRVTGDSLAVAFRDFHLWTIFAGQRANRQYFSFAHALPTPTFASSAEGLPALSVHNDPALAPWGATQVRLLPSGREGGLRIHFEGDFLAQWQADLLLTDTSGALRRVAVPLSPSSRGQITVPQQGLVEAVLLIRNLGSDDAVPRRYTYAAYPERAYPVEWGTFDAIPVVGDDEAHGVLVGWETTSELDVIGFNVLRLREDEDGTGRAGTAANPVWIPAVGSESGEGVAYRYLDATARPGSPLVYRIEAVTSHGLSNLSSPIVVRWPSPPARATVP